MGFGQRLDRRPNVGLGLVQLQDLYPPPALAQDVRRTIGHTQDAPDHHLHTDGIEIVQSRLLNLGIALGNNNEEVVATHGLFHRLQGAIAPHEQRSHHVRKDDCIAQRQQRKIFRRQFIAVIGQPIHIEKTKVKIVTQTEFFLLNHRESRAI